MSDDAKPLGRPEIDVDMDQLKALMRFKPTRDEAAAIMKCSGDTIERRIKEDSGQTYREFQEQHMTSVKIKLRQMAIDKALKGDDYWLAKCNEEFGWFGKRGDSPVQVNVQTNVSNTVNIEPMDLEDRIKQIKGEDT